MTPLEWAGPLAQGLQTTLLLTGCGAALATVLALLAGLARLSPLRSVRSAARVYVEVFRGTSALVQLFWFYYALPLVGVRLDAFTASALVLGLNTGAYGAEVVRGALMGISREQWDAAAALRLSRWQTLRRIILPQAIVDMLPPANNLLIELLKNTALVSLVTIADLTFQAQALRAATLESGAIFGVVLLTYFAMATLLTAGMRRFERHAGRWREGTA